MENTTDYSRVQSEEIDRILQDKFEKKYSLSIKVWVPTIVSILIATISGTWFFFEYIEKKAAEVKKEATESYRYYRHGGKERNLYRFLENTDGILLEEIHNTIINNVLWEMNQRKDLVLIIAGYTDDKLDRDQISKASESSLAADRIRKKFIQLGIPENRIFCNGYGAKVPNRFPKTSRLNIGLIVCDIFYIMENADILI